jgi:hypothetical protein
VVQLFLLVRLWVIRAVMGLDTLDTSEVEEISRFPLLWCATARCCSESLPCGHSLARIGILCNLCCCISLVSAHFAAFSRSDLCSRRVHVVSFGALFWCRFLACISPGVSVCRKCFSLLDRMFGK